MTDFLDARALRQDNVLLIGPFPEGQRLEDPNAPGVLDPSFRRCTIALVIAWPGVRTPYPRVARLLHAQGIAYTLMLCGLPGTGESGALAAFFPIEDKTPCWRCLELRWLGWAADVPGALAWLESLQFPELVEGLTPNLPPEETQVLLTWAAMDVIGADAGAARVVLDDGTFSVHSFLPHPQCAWCSPWSGVKPLHPPPPHLLTFIDEQLGLFRLDQGTVLPESLDAPAPAGPDTVLTTAARGDNVRWHRVHLADPAPYLSNSAAWRETLAFGGSDDMPATLFLDAFARYAMHLRAGRPLWRGTRRGVALPAPDPRRWMSPVVAPADGERDYSESLELDWARAHDLHSGDVVAIPADLVYAGPPHDRLPRGDAATAVAHPRLNVAVRWALSQVAENDGLMAAWYGGLPPVRLDAERLAAPWRDALAEARERAMQIEVVDLTTDLGIPVLAVFGRHAGRWFHGCGASWQPERALRTAWERAGQCFLRALPDPGEAIDFLFEGPLGECPTKVPGGDTDPIDTWRMLLRMRGLQGLWIDITPPDVASAGVVVARAWVLGALPRPPLGAPLSADPDRLRASPAGVRLLELPVRLGRRRKPLTPTELNLRPHPFI